MVTKNRVIHWAIRDQQGYRKSGYRKSLDVIIIDKKVAK